MGVGLGGGGEVVLRKSSRLCQESARQLLHVIISYGGKSASVDSLRPREVPLRTGIYREEWRAKFILNFHLPSFLHLHPQMYGCESLGRGPNLAFFLKKKKVIFESEGLRIIKRHKIETFSFFI